MPLPKVAQPYIFYTEKTVDPGSVGANACLTVNVSASKALPTHFIMVQTPTLHSSLAVGGCVCLSAGVITVKLVNPTGTPIDDGSQTWKFLAR